MSFRINQNLGPSPQTIHDINSFLPSSQDEKIEITQFPSIPDREAFRYKPTPANAYIPPETNTIVDISRTSQSLLEKDRIIYDKTTKRWKIIKESEAYRYAF